MENIYLDVREKLIFHLLPLENTITVKLNIKRYIAIYK